MSRLRALVPSLFALALVAVACSTGAAEEAASDQASLRALTPAEILGEIRYGETKDVDYTPAPKYRAFWFFGERGDQIQAQVVTLDATDPILWLTDEDFDNLSVNNDVRVTDTNSLINGRFLPKTGKYWLVFREMYGAPRAKFAVSLRKLGALPPECDPDGEGIWDSECTDPLGFDPFDPASCTGEPLTRAQATTLFGDNGGLRLTNARVYYRTRQCMIDQQGGRDCSPWVRAFAMDVRLGTIAPTPAPSADAPAPPTWTITAEGTRKAKIELYVEPAATKQICLDGPFAGAAGGPWTAFADGTPGLCTTSAPVTLTRSCARFEPPSIELPSGNPTYFTELGLVVLAKF
jgi:hypothetical protein